MASGRYSQFTVNSTAGVTLAAKWWNSDGTDTSKPVIIFIHQYAIMGGQGQLMEGMARIAAKKGFESVTFDLRGAGRSTGRSSWMNSNELSDVEAMINYVEGATSKDIFLVGSSGGAPLAGAVLDKSHRIIGGMFIGYVWGFWASILFGWAYASIKASSKPKLFIVGTKDEFTSMDQYRMRIAQLSGDVNIMKVIDGKNHFEIEAPVYDKTMLDYLDEFISEKVVAKHNSCTSNNLVN